MSLALSTKSQFFLFNLLLTHSDKLYVLLLLLLLHSSTLQQPCKRILLLIPFYHAYPFADVLIERLKQYSPGAGVDTTSGIEDPVAQGKSQSCSEVKGDGNRPPLTELSNQLPRRLIRPKPATSAGLSSGAVRIPILSQIDDALDDL